MSVAGKRQSTIGPSHTGGPKSGFYAKPGTPGLDVHHDPMDARKGDHGVKGNLARDGAAKRLDPVAPHSSTTVRQLAGVGVGGMAHGSAVVSGGGEVVATSAAAVPPVPASRRGFNSPAVPHVALTHAYGSGVPKVRNGAPAHSGTRSRNADAVGGAAAGVNHARAQRTDLPALGRAILDEAARGRPSIKPTIRIGK